MSRITSEYSLQFGGKQGTDHTGIRIELVEPSSPEFGHSRIRDGDTTECCQGQPKERVEQRSSLCYYVSERQYT